MDYGKAIKIARARRGVSQRKLAKLIKVDASYISKLEAGRRKPSLDLLGDISASLNIPVYLLSLMASEAGDIQSGLSIGKLEEVTGALLSILTEVDLVDDEANA